MCEQGLLMWQKKRMHNVKCVDGNMISWITRQINRIRDSNIENSEISVAAQVVQGNGMYIFLPISPV